MAIIAALLICDVIGVVQRAPEASRFRTPVRSRVVNMKQAEAVDADVLVVGAGPAGTMLAWQMAEKFNAKVALVDPKLDDPWPNNYGVWMHEWEALEKELGFGLNECLGYTWPFTECYLGGEGNPGTTSGTCTRIAKAYARVDREKLKDRAMAGLEKAQVRLLRTRVDGSEPSAVSHGPSASTVRCVDGTEVRAKVIVDASNGMAGLSTKAGEDNPGFQIAYGAMCDVDSHPFKEDTMLFMDYRTDWMTAPSVTTTGEFGPARTVTAEAVENEPTFLYAMPFGEAEGGGRKIFFEETSLVARPPMDFDECKARLELRLKHLGIKVRSVEEEEFCYIPMGGALPSTNQRVVAIGASAGTVHAATGYMMCRMLASTLAVSKAIASELDVATAQSFSPERAAAAAYAALLPLENRLQRDFCVFGGEYLMRQSVTGLRGFFSGFFDLPDEQWTGFLAGWPGLPGNDAHDSWEKRLVFGINLWIRVPFAVKLSLAVSAMQFGGIGFFRSVLPILHESAFQELPMAGLRSEGERVPAQL